jgi:Zn-dependent M28 family amino/carboxypeptidase
MKRLLTVFLLSALVVQAHGDARRIDPLAYIQHVKFLASDDLEGRGDGATGLEKAAEYIEKTFRASGLEPGGDAGTFFQTFQLVTGIALEPGNTLSLTLGGTNVAFEIGRDYRIISTSSVPSVPATLPVVFAGYGITAPAQHYDDYADIDASGKAVLLFTHEPQEEDPRSAFEGQTNTAHSTILRKVEAARAHGASAIVLIDDMNHRVQPDQYRQWMRDPQAEEYGLPVFHVSRDRVQQALGTSLNLAAVSREIDRAFAAKSQLLRDASLTLVDRTQKVRKPVRNVVGMLKGNDPARNGEVVVVGAHYDHLGRSARFSMSPESAGQIHHGADDNASGTAAVLEMAKAAVESRSDIRRSIIFITFAGEELGLLGSSHFVSHPPVPLERIVAMINLDMVGRPGGRILIDGFANAPALEQDLNMAQGTQTGRGIKLAALHGSAGTGASDDATFIGRKIPAINFFSGFHSDYHRPSDTWDKIDAAGGAGVADLALALTRQIANRPERPEFVETVQEQHSSSSTGAPASGYGPYFGSVPDFANEGQGVKFSDVRSGSPAGKAGFKAGDVMTSFGGAPIKTLYDFTFALRDKKPGDKVEVTVLRDGKPITATVELANRP